MDDGGQRKKKSTNQVQSAPSCGYYPKCMDVNNFQFAFIALLACYRILL